MENELAENQKDSVGEGVEGVGAGAGVGRVWRRRVCAGAGAGASIRRESCGSFAGGMCWRVRRWLGSGGAGHSAGLRLRCWRLGVVMLAGHFVCEGLERVEFMRCGSVAACWQRRRIGLRGCWGRSA